MKRSEMVNIIAKVIASYRQSDPTRNDLFIANDIINKQEEVGMRPPEYYRDKVDEYYGNEGGWEPENE